MRSLIAAVTLFVAAGTLAQADEGMWLFNEFPKDRIARKYGFQVTDQFLDHLRAGSVRFNNGGSGSFISPSGLLFTNHHVGAECIQNLSSAQHDYMANGFYAATQADERTCPDLEVNVLLKIDDVTPKITGATTGKSTVEAEKARRAAIAQVEKSCMTETGNRCDVVTLFSGGKYHLYQYHKYTDVRLVLAPEYDVAAFGKDPDNFTYPRYCLDFTLFRAYENGKPVESKSYFRWNSAGAKEKDLVFVPGNPGSTGRLATVAELEFDRDVLYPLSLESIQGRGGYAACLLGQGAGAGAPGDPGARVRAEQLQGLLRLRAGAEGAVGDCGEAEAGGSATGQGECRREDEGRVRRHLGPGWPGPIASTVRCCRRRCWFESRPARGSEPVPSGAAHRALHRGTKKPNGERLREYRDSALPALKEQFASKAPIYKDLEAALLANYLTLAEKKFGAADPTVKALLNGKTPQEPLPGT